MGNLKKQSYFNDVLKRFVNHRLAITGTVVLFLLIVTVTVLPMSISLEEGFPMGLLRRDFRWGLTVREGTTLQDWSMGDGYLFW